MHEPDSLLIIVEFGITPNIIDDFVMEWRNINHFLRNADPVG